MSNPVVHFEINGTDRSGTAKFYSELFGWHTQDMPDMKYQLVDTHAGEGINGGFGDSEDGSKYATIYVEVDDPQATLDKAESLGGKTLVPVTELPMVTLAQFSDPEGNRVGVVKSGPEDGPGVSPGSNPAVGWFEILGKDAEGLHKFYRSLFGWEIKIAPSSDESPEGMVYGQVEAKGGKGIPGGIGNTPMDPQVSVYAEVSDLQKYLDKAISLGGKTVMEPTQVAPDTKIASFLDPEGRYFGMYLGMGK